MTWNLGGSTDLCDKTFLYHTAFEKFLGNDSEIIAFGKDEIFQDDEALKNDGRLVEAKNSTNLLQNIFHLLKVSSVAMDGWYCTL